MIRLADEYLFLLYDYFHRLLYEYQRTRNASHLRTFLKDYEGICVKDGYQVYHTVEKDIGEWRKS